MTIDYFKEYSFNTAHVNILRTKSKLPDFAEFKIVYDTTRFETISWEDIREILTNLPFRNSKKDTGDKIVMKFFNVLIQKLPINNLESIKINYKNSCITAKCSDD